MNRFFLGLLGVAVLASVSLACGIGPRTFSVFQRILYSDVTVLGTITSIERDEIEIPNPQPTLPPMSFRVAVVRIEQAIGGAKNVTHVKVLFTGEQLCPGQEVCLFLNRHATQTGYFTAASQAPWLDRANPRDKATWTALETVLPAVSDPVAALKSGDDNERFRAAAYLTLRYRKTAAGVPADKYDTESVSADESQLILNALADVDWDRATDGVNHWEVYHALGLKQENGGFPHCDVLADGKLMPLHFRGGRNEMRTAFQQWLTERGATYQIQKLIPKADLK
jgi:hypothetical protein